MDNLKSGDRIRYNEKSSELWRGKEYTLGRPHNGSNGIQNGWYLIDNDGSKRGWDKSELFELVIPQASKEEIEAALTKIRDLCST